MNSKTTASALAHLLFRFANFHPGCTGKIQHATMLLATKAAYRMEEKTGEPFEPYACAMCGYYHIGHARKRSFE